MEKLKVFTAFSGYDSQCMALERLASNFPGFAYELVGWSEIDRCAIEAHNACFPQWADRNYGDISEIDWGEVPDFDLFTYSFPCQDISVAGHQNGLSEGSGTRSSLLWECERAIASKRPKYLLMENVAALTHRKFIPQLMRWEDILSGYGYASHRRTLNASDFGVPQSRNRVFLASLLDGIRFVFPTPVTPPTSNWKTCLTGMLTKAIISATNTCTNAFCVLETSRGRAASESWLTLWRKGLCNAAYTGQTVCLQH